MSLDAKLKNSFILSEEGAAVAAGGSINVYFDLRPTDRAELFCSATSTGNIIEFDVTMNPPDAGSGTMKVRRVASTGGDYTFDPHLLIEGKKRVTITLYNREVVTAADLELFVSVKVYANE